MHTEQLPFDRLSVAELARVLDVPVHALELAAVLDVLARHRLQAERGPNGSLHWDRADVEAMLAQERDYRIGLACGIRAAAAAASSTTRNRP